MKRANFLLWNIWTKKNGWTWQNAMQKVIFKFIKNKNKIKFWFALLIWIMQIIFFWLGFTPLTISARASQIDIIDYLAGRIDLTTSDGNGNSCLTMAAANGKVTFTNKYKILHLFWWKWNSFELINIVIL